MKVYCRPGEHLRCIESTGWTREDGVGVGDVVTVQEITRFGFRRVGGQYWIEYDHFVPENAYSEEQYQWEEEEWKKTFQ